MEARKPEDKDGRIRAAVVFADMVHWDPLAKEFETHDVGEPADFIVEMDGALYLAADLLVTVQFLDMRPEDCAISLRAVCQHPSPQVVIRTWAIGTESDNDTWKAHGSMRDKIPNDVERIALYVSGVERWSRPVRGTAT